MAREIVSVILLTCPSFFMQPITWGNRQVLVVEWWPFKTNKSPTSGRPEVLYGQAVKLCELLRRHVDPDNPISHMGCMPSIMESEENKDDGLVIDRKTDKSDTWSLHWRNASRIKYANRVMADAERLVEKQSKLGMVPPDTIGTSGVIGTSAYNLLINGQG